MFTGIIETIAVISKIEKKQGNLNITLKSSLTATFKIDQSISHNGICLTVVFIKNNEYVVTAIDETIQKSSIGSWRAGDLINLERAMKIGDRLDGHMIQGHVDQIGKCSKIIQKNGSWIFTIQYAKSNNVTVEKGSIAINGISLTVVNSNESDFSVAIIPYTYEHTNFKNLNTGDSVNLEFDILGKYIAKMLSKSN
ncbi:riboflavin synthase [Flavobacteriaceae bacterium]|jgi:riboflavin synthase|nr:riboflavin synthase [Flavobacteriaceae bacterium]|tara:strand:+ start:6630 stop:7217 length:588 start_codon:yes stop_codon:yes gene_type:complete